MKSKKVKNQPTINNPNFNSSPSITPNVSTDSEEIIEPFLSNQKIAWICLGALCVLILIIRSNFKDLPFERDEGTYSYMGHALLQGKSPYIDFYDMKFPFLFYSYACMVGLFGFTLNGLHAGFMLLNIGSTILSYSLSKRLFGTYQAGLMGATCFALLSLNPFLSGFTIQSEHLVVFFTFVGIHFLYDALDEETTRWKFLLAGITMALAFMIKTNAVFIAVAGGLALAIEFFFKKDYKNLFVNGLYYVLGGAASVAFFLVLSSMQGSWEATRFWVFDYANAYVGQIPWEEGMKLFWAMWAGISANYYAVFVYPALAGIGLIWLCSFSLARKIGLVTLFFASILTIKPGLRFFGHYWLQILPLASIFFTGTWVGLQKLIENKTGFGRFAVYATTSLCVLLTFLHIKSNAIYYFNDTTESLMRAVYDKNPFLEAKKVGDYIKTIAQPSDQVALVGAEPQMYLYTGLDAPTRHHYFAFMVQTDTLAVPKTVEWVKEFNNDLITKKPRFIVFFKHNISTSAVNNSAIDYFNKAFNERIAPNYRPVGIAETKPDKSIVCTFGEAKLLNYKAQADNLVYIFERK